MNGQTVTLITPIIEVNHGIANNFGDCIEINKHLKSYPHLLNPILAHEQQHTGQKFSEDFKLDIINNPSYSQLDLLKFMIKHPRSFSQLLPFYYSRTKKRLIYDTNSILMYLIFGGILLSTIYIGVKYL